MTTALSFVRLLALVLWVGGLCFFAFVVAPVAFRTLPSTHEAGLVVGASLRILHNIGLCCGLVLLGTYAALPISSRESRLRWLPPILSAFMLLLTAYSQFVVIPEMERDRLSAGGEIAQAPTDSDARASFDRLHKLSERIEGSVLLAGIALVWLHSRVAARPVGS
jgi:uncharacterized membrane protein